MSNQIKGGVATGDEVQEIFNLANTFIKENTKE